MSAVAQEINESMNKIIKRELRRLNISRFLDYLIEDTLLPGSVKPEWCVIKIDKDGNGNFGVLYIDGPPKGIWILNTEAPGYDEVLKTLLFVEQVRKDRDILTRGIGHEVNEKRMTRADLRYRYPRIELLAPSVKGKDIFSNRSRKGAKDLKRLVGIYSMMV